MINWEIRKHARNNHSGVNITHKEHLGNSRMGKGMVFPLWTFSLWHNSLLWKGILTFFPHTRGNVVDPPCEACYSPLQFDGRGLKVRDFGIHSQHSHRIGRQLQAVKTDSFNGSNALGTSCDVIYVEFWLFYPVQSWWLIKLSNFNWLLNLRIKNHVLDFSEIVLDSTMSCTWSLLLLLLPCDFTSISIF